MRCEIFYYPCQHKLYLQSPFYFFFIKMRYEILIFVSNLTSKISYLIILSTTRQSGFP